MNSNAPGWDLLIINARVAPMIDGVDTIHSDYAIAIRGASIAWLGPTNDLVGSPEESADKVINAQGQLVTPALIDCHTHLVFGGHRAAEFEQRLNGVSYEQIAKSGGGIQSTVNATRACSDNELADLAEQRIACWLDEGVATIEIKSGYGLDLETERKMLRTARRLGERSPLTTVSTFLGAHTIPSEWKDNADGYVEEVIAMLKVLHAEGLVDHVDAYMERIAFSAEQVSKIFKVANELDLPVKLHADQLSHGGGAQVAAEFQALSADHVEYTDDKGARAMAKSGIVAVLLPAAYYTLRESTPPPIDLFRKHGVSMAVATDANPGTSPTLSLLTAMNMACTLFKLTPAEVLAAVTCHAASALGLDDRGTLRIGDRADIALWKVNTPAELCYWLGARPLKHLICGGELAR